MKNQNNQKLLTCEKFELLKSVYEKFKAKVSINYLCKLAFVSSSGYYNYFSKKSIDFGNKQTNQDIKDVNIIKEILGFRSFKKGSRTIKMLLLTMKKLVWSRKKIQHLMRKFNIVYPIRKSNPYRKLTYLSAIKDSATKVIIAHNMSKSLAMPLVTETIDKLMNVDNFKVNKNTILHSNQGCHYTSRL